jgi:iron complex outermembrane recepter protein
LIRGIGQLDFPPTTEAGVDLYVDNVYLPRSPGAVLDLSDVQQVEILKGPQGTLFGKNAIGGAINVTTKSPDFEHLSGSGSITLGQWRRRNADAELNVPINLDLAARGSRTFRVETSAFFAAVPQVRSQLVDRAASRTRRACDESAVTIVHASL